MTGTWSGEGAASCSSCPAGRASSTVEAVSIATCSTSCIPGEDLLALHNRRSLVNRTCRRSNNDFVTYLSCVVMPQCSLSFHLLFVMNVSSRFKLRLMSFLMPGLICVFVDPRQAPGPAREPLPAAHVQWVGPQVQSKQSRSRIAHCVKVANMRTLQQPHLVFSVQRVGLQVQSKRFRS